MNENYLRDLLDENTTLQNKIEDIESERDNLKKALLQSLTTITDVLKDKSLSKESKSKLENCLSEVAKTVYR